MKTEKANSKNKNAGNKTTEPKKDTSHLDPSTLTEINRLSALADYSDFFTTRTLKGLFTRLGTKRPEELKQLIKDKSLTSIERTAVKALAIAMSSEKNALDAVKYVHDRTFGKLPDKLEMAGNDGAPIALEVDLNTEFRDMASSLSNKQLKELKKLAQGFKDVVGDGAKPSKKKSN